MNTTLNSYPIVQFTSDPVVSLNGQCFGIPAPTHACWYTPHNQAHGQRCRLLEWDYSSVVITQVGSV
jgi:hypothetical protein